MNKNHAHAEQSGMIRAIGIVQSGLPE